MRYKIIPDKLEYLRKKVKAIENKGAPVVFEVVGEGYAKIDTIRTRKYIEVEIEANYIINGYKFIGVIEHKIIQGEAGYTNIVRNITSESIPARFKTCAPYCEHCGVRRYRKDTYIIRNEKTGEYKQVGKNCLTLYTGGLDASLCASYYEFLLYCEGCRFRIDDDFLKECKDNNCDCFNAKKVKTLMYNYIKANGYVKDKFLQCFFEYMREQSQADIKINNNFINDFTAFCDKLNTSLDYNYNLNVANKLEALESRDFKLVASGIFKYINCVARIKKESKSEYLGNVGERIEFKVKTAVVLYVKDNRSCSYYACDTYVYKINDAKGNIIIWSTANRIHEGECYKATITKCDEREGVKQTTISRGVLTKKAPIKKQSKNSVTAQKGFDTFIDYLEQ